MSVAVVMPFWSEEPTRLAAATWTTARLQGHLPRGVEFLFGDDGSSPPFRRAAVSNWLASRTDADALVLADADVAVEWGPLLEAVAKVEQGAAWAIPYDDYRHLTPTSTDELLTGRRPVDIGTLPRVLRYTKRFVASTPPLGRFGGSVCGVLVVRTEAFWHVGGYDTRFDGNWGWEDTSLAAALWTFNGPPIRERGVAFHLWHPLDPRRYTDNPNRELGARYNAAMGDEQAMASLLLEASRA